MESFKVAKEVIDSPFKDKRRINEAIGIRLESDTELSIHCADLKDKTFKEKIDLLKDGLWSTAFFLRERSPWRNVDKITATSWIVKEHPKLMESLGFTIVYENTLDVKIAKAVYKRDSIKNSNVLLPKLKKNTYGEPEYAYMTRKKFLSMYGDKGKINILSTNKAQMTDPKKTDEE